jgi:putative transposase
MGFVPETFYHVYNRGNNKQMVFLRKRHYLLFLKKIKKHIAPHCEILAYCIMPNHFHLLISTKDSESISKLSNGIKVTLSSFARARNNELKHTGSVFQQNTKKKKIRIDDRGRYLQTVFNYIHDNPSELKSKFTEEFYPYSSKHEYLASRRKEGLLCNQEFTRKFLEIFQEVN